MMDELRILVPLMDDLGGILHLEGPSGQTYPVLCEPGADSAVSSFTDVLRRRLTGGPAARALRMERQSRLAAVNGAGGSSGQNVSGDSPSNTLPGALGPAFLLLSDREGGFADRPSPSTKMHMSMSVTDYQTAFDEGFAEHFQTVVADQIGSAAPHQVDLVAQVRGLWHSGIDAHMRVHGVRGNLCVHGKAIPTCIDECSDPYELYLDSETSILFDHGTLKTGQQMMACEGVIATPFYRMINDEHLAGAGPDIDLKIIAAIGAMRRRAEPTVPMMEEARQFSEYMRE